MQTWTSRWPQHVLRDKHTWCKFSCSCNHKEVDIRLFVHEGYAFKEGWQRPWFIMLIPMWSSSLSQAFRVNIYASELRVSFRLCITCDTFVYGLLQYHQSHSNHAFFLRSMHIQAVILWVSLQQRGENGLEHMEVLWHHIESFHSVTVDPNNTTSYISTIEHFSLLLCNRTSRMLSSLVDKGWGCKTYQ